MIYVVFDYTLSCFTMNDKKSQRIGSILGKEYLESAFLFAQLAENIESLPREDKRFSWIVHKSFVKSSVIASACYMEATINEWYSMCEGKMNSKNKDALKAMAALWNLGIPRTASYPILKKYQIALVQLGITDFEEGLEPYQSANSVIDLRNWLVHYELSMEPVETEESLSEYKAHKLRKKLRGKFPLNPLCAETAPFWPIKCLGSGCAFWAARSSFVFVDEFFKKTAHNHFLRVDESRINEIRQIAVNFMQQH